MASIVYSICRSYYYILLTDTLLVSADSRGDVDERRLRDSHVDCHRRYGRQRIPGVAHQSQRHLPHHAGRLLRPRRRIASAGDLLRHPGAALLPVHPVRIPAAPDLLHHEPARRVVGHAGSGDEEIGRGDTTREGGGGGTPARREAQEEGAAVVARTRLVRQRPQGVLPVDDRAQDDGRRRSSVRHRRAKEADRGPQG